MSWKPGDGKDPHWKAEACGIAEIVCRWQLERIYGSVEEGMKQIGVRNFNRWILHVERAIESSNPTDDEDSIL